MFFKNSGTPKSSILIGFSIINLPFWGTPILGNTLYLSWWYFPTHLQKKMFVQIGSEIPRWQKNKTIETTTQCLALDQKSWLQICLEKLKNSTKSVISTKGNQPNGVMKITTSQFKKCGQIWEIIGKYEEKTALSRIRICQSLAFPPTLRMHLAVGQCFLDHPRFLDLDSRQRVLSMVGTCTK